MKIKIKNKFIYILLAITLLVAFFPLAKTVSHADGTQVVSSDIDENLFEKLSRVKGGTAYTYLTTDSFNFPKFETIDLSGEGTIDKESNIKDISGLTKFKFDYTKVLILSDNSILEVTSEVLSAFPKLEKLVVSGNELSGIDISGCYNLKTLVADNNFITELDATDMVATDAEIDLSNNLLSSIYDITLPSQVIDVNMTLKLYNNNITDYEGLGDNYKVYLGLQGLQFPQYKDFVQQKQEIVYYKTNDGQQVKTVITEDGVEKYSFVDADITEERASYDIPNGTYEISYYFIKPDGSLVESSTKKNPNPIGTFYAYDPAIGPEDERYESHNVNTYLRYYKYRVIKVIPSTPVYTYIIDGKEYVPSEVTKVKKKSTIKVVADEGTTVFYKIGGLDWEKGNEIPIEHGGRYEILVKAVTEDGLHTSEEVTIYMYASANLHLPDILMLMLIIIGAVLIFAVGFPLLRKYVL